MNALVTGGCGFVGSNLVDMLVEQGHSVTVIDNLSSNAHDQFYYNDHATYYDYSVIDYVMCSQVFERNQPYLVFHLAAEARIQNCIEDPSLCIETNVMGTQTMLELCKKHDVRRMVFMSTSAIYGLANTAPQIETGIPDCLNSYSLSKFFGENLCRMYSKMYGLDTVCFRGFNIFGNRQPKKGTYAPVIGVFSRQIDDDKSLTIVGDGEQRRDFIHVSDVCRGLIAGAKSNNPQLGEIYNIGSGTNYSVNDIADMVSRARAHTLAHTHIPSRMGEARITLADISKIKSSLGWEPHVSLSRWVESFLTTP